MGKHFVDKFGWEGGEFVGGGIVEEGVHGVGLLFALLPPAFGAHSVRHRETRGAVQPAGEMNDAVGLGALRGERGEHGLGDVGREGGVAAELAERGAVDEIHVAAHDLGKRLFGGVMRVALEEFAVGEHGAVCR